MGTTTKTIVKKYLDEAKKRAEKSSEITKIDQQIADEKQGIDIETQFLAALPKSVQDTDRGQRQFLLLPVAEKLKLGAYVEFL